MDKQDDARTLKAHTVRLADRSELLKQLFYSTRFTCLSVLSEKDSARVTTPDAMRLERPHTKTVIVGPFMESDP